MLIYRFPLSSLLLLPAYNGYVKQRLLKFFTISFNNLRHPLAFEWFLSRVLGHFLNIFSLIDAQRCNLTLVFHQFHLRSVGVKVMRILLLTFVNCCYKSKQPLPSKCYLWLHYHAEMCNHNTNITTAVYFYPFYSQHGERE